MNNSIGTPSSFQTARGQCDQYAQLGDLPRQKKNCPREPPSFPISLNFAINVNRNLNFKIKVVLKYSFKVSGNKLLRFKSEGVSKFVFLNEGGGWGEGRCTDK